jgi:hypothetical protein
VQDFAGGRETGLWFAEHTPPGAVAHDDGSVARQPRELLRRPRLLRVVGQHDPKLRNPAYRPIPNPDYDIRQLQVQYAVWDAYTNDRAPFFGQPLDGLRPQVLGHAGVLGVGRRQHGRYSNGPPPPDAEVRIVVYQLVGGDPLVQRDRTTETGA